MSVKENLIKAKALIDTPEKWIKGEYAVDNCYCIIGAVASAIGKNIRAAENGDVCHALVTEVPERTSDFICELHMYNDLPSTTHADIMALFDRAIEAAND